jgi:hypothetical protein
MKCRRKPIGIDAEQYLPGMEDGFLIKFQDLNHSDRLNNIPKSIEEKPVKVPYILTRYGGYKRVKKGDWILKSKDGAKDVWKNNKFIKNWELVLSDVNDEYGEPEEKKELD